MIAGILRRAGSLDRGAIAVDDGDRALTYGETCDRVARLAGELADRGVQAGDRVALLAPNSRLFFEAYFAAAWGGAALVPLNTRLHPEALARILEHAGARLLLVHPAMESTAAALAGQCPVPQCAAAELERDLAFRTPRDAAAVDPAAPAQIYYTSGTTGEPKGVVLTHRNVCTHALMAAAALRLDDRDVFGHFAPMFHLADAWATFAVTWMGGSHRMLERFEARAALDLLCGGVTLTNLVPTMLGDLMEAAGGRPLDTTLRLVLSGGAPIAPALVDRVVSTLRCEYVQTYGLTETSPFLTMSLLPERLRRLPEAEQRRYRCKTGRPLAGVELRVVRDDGREVARDGTEAGEVIVRGDSVTPGYWQNPAATAAAFQGGWFHTGDLAVVDSEGFLTLVDRRKDIIKTGGETVFSTEVEHVLCDHPDVVEAAVFGVPHRRWGEAVVAAVVVRHRGPDPGPAAAEPAEARLLQHCRAHLGGPQTPKKILLRDALPRTGSGKITKRVLREEYRELFAAEEEGAVDS